MKRSKHVLPIACSKSFPEERFKPGNSGADRKLLLIMYTLQKLGIHLWNWISLKFTTTFILIESRFPAAFSLQWGCGLLMPMVFKCVPWREYWIKNLDIQVYATSATSLGTATVNTHTFLSVSKGDSDTLVGHWDPSKKLLSLQDGFK